MVGTANLTVTHTGHNTEGTADRLVVRTPAWEAVVWVSFGMWPSIELRAFSHTCGGETPTTAERGRVRRAALKWVRESR